MCACGCVRIQRHFVGYSSSRFVCLAVLLYLYDDLMNMNTVQGYMIVLIDKKNTIFVSTYKIQFRIVNSHTNNTLKLYSTGTSKKMLKDKIRVKTC